MEISFFEAATFFVGLYVSGKLGFISSSSNEEHVLCNYLGAMYQTWQDGDELNWLPPIKLFKPLVKWSCTITWETKIIIFPLPHCLWQSLKSNDPSITWSCWIVWQTKNIISPLPQFLWSPNVASLQLTFRDSHPDIHMTL